MHFSSGTNFLTFIPEASYVVWVSNFFTRSFLILHYNVLNKNLSSWWYPSHSNRFTSALQAFPNSNLGINRGLTMLKWFSILFSFMPDADIEDCSCYLDFLISLYTLHEVSECLDIEDMVVKKSPVILMLMGSLLLRIMVTLPASLFLKVLFPMCYSSPVFSSFSNYRLLRCTADACALQ